LTPAGTLSVFGFKTPIPYPFGLERTGYLLTDLDGATRAARAAGADVLVSPFDDPIGREAIIQWPGGVDSASHNPFHRSPQGARGRSGALWNCCGRDWGRARSNSGASRDSLRIPSVGYEAKTARLPVLPNSPEAGDLLRQLSSGYRFRFVEGFTAPNFADLFENAPFAE
jgi:hypothetical protein